VETSLPLVDNGRPAARVGLAFQRLSTFPQPRPSTAARRLTSAFTETIHRLIHRTLTLHPRGWRDRSMLSCWPRGPSHRPGPAACCHREDHRTGHALVSFVYVRNRSARTTEDGQPRSRTLLTYDGLSPTDLKSVLGTPSRVRTRILRSYDQAGWSDASLASGSAASRPGAGSNPLRMRRGSDAAQHPASI
jgi:hypothetical protein